MFAKLVRRAVGGRPQVKAEAPAPVALAPPPLHAGAPATVEPGALAGGVSGASAEALARERLRAFAFAAADMLLETNADGTIGFATGRFEERFGEPADGQVGRRITSLIAPGDQSAFAMALAMLPLRRRMAPMVLHLSDAARSLAAVSAVHLGGPPARLCFAIGPVPVAPVAEVAGLADGIHQPASFAREAEASLRSGSGRLGLIEVQGWKAVKERLTQPEQSRLRAGIGALMGESGPGARASELADGRYGVLGMQGGGMEALLRRLEQFISRSAARSIARVSGTEVALEPSGMPAATASRVLRYAVSRFTAEGTAAVTAVGSAGGLAGILAQAEMRAQAVRAALGAHRFRLAFQPVVSLEDRAVHHYEALLRPVATPGTPVHSIQEFVTFAEAVGLSEVMDYAVLEQALTALRAAPAASVAVNISGLSMQSPAFCGRMFALLDEMRPVIGGPPKGRLLVELTETSEVEDMEAAAATIARLRAQGVWVCLDDFGAGAAAFRYLQQFRIDIVKIDGAFVRAAVDGARERAMVASMVELATAAGAQTVAEMVETEEQAALMRALGVHQGQGWLFGRPGALPGARR